jgi:putative acyl-CoA dehydrogenase
LFAELNAVRGENAALDGEVQWLATAFDDKATLESRSRLVTERAALALQGAILLKAGNATVADAFCASRLGGAHGMAFGTLEPGAAIGGLIEGAWGEG